MGWEMIYGKDEEIENDEETKKKKTERDRYNEYTKNEERIFRIWDHLKGEVPSLHAGG